MPSPPRFSVMASFQSTPPHGRRRDSARLRNHERTSFNPRLRTGGDVSVALAPVATVVSIHASAREATRTYQRMPARLDRFNPRLRTGGDTARPALSKKPTRFQSTPPHGRRRPVHRLCGARQLGFNPRLRTGGDRIKIRLYGIDCPVSIHASAREATGPGKSLTAARSSFNPRLRTGGDRAVAAYFGSESSVSIHASAREATLIMRRKWDLT